MNNTVIYKDRQGQSWFLGFYSNNFSDRDNEIFTWESHLDYAKWVKDTGVKLPVTVMHQPQYPLEVHLAQFVGLASGKITAEEFSTTYRKLYGPVAFAETEAIIPVNGFMLVVAKILKDKEDTVQLLLDTKWRMSHGFLKLSDDDGIISNYRTFEFTVLPGELAANSFTTSSIKEITMDEMKGMQAEDREKLKALLGDNVNPEAIEEATEAAQAVLEKVLDSKSVTSVADYEEIRSKIFTDLGVEQLNAAFSQIVEAVKGMQARLDGYEQRIAATERSEDERIAETFLRPNWKMFADSVVEAGTEPTLEELREQALGEKPVDGVKAAAKTDNPLVIGWMNPMGFSS